MSCVRILQIGMHDHIGGVETFLMNYYRNIDKTKVQFDFINPYEKLCFEEEIKSLGGRVYKIRNFKRKPIGYCNDIKKIIKENNYNIIHINMLSAANVLPIIVAKRLKVKTVITHSHNSNTPPNIIKKLLHCLNKKILRQSTDFFACSKKAGEWLFGKKTLKEKKLNVINNAIDTEKFLFNEDIRKRIRKELDIEENFVVGHVGRFCYQKNHEFLIDIFYEILKVKSNAKLLLIGEGELQEKIKGKVNKLGIKENVIFYGTTGKVNELLQAMDVFILPSKFEGLPVIGIEAQASGVKCIFSKEISKEAKIIEGTEFISLEKEAKFWCNEIIHSFENFNRKNEIKSIDSNGYNIKKEAKKLENFYIMKNDEKEQ